MMNDKALVDLMELLKIFESYTYYRDSKEFYIHEMSMIQFAKLYVIIQKYDLRFKIDNGVRVWLN